ncbi:MAG: hypothetical protein WD689_08225 [Gaiellaceae bacterium]
MRLAVALAAACAVLALGALIVTAAPQALVPQASAAQAEYCPPGELRRRFQAYKRFTKQMSQQRYRYFQLTRSARARAAFVRKQKAQQRALLRVLLRCD